MKAHLLIFDGDSVTLKKVIKIVDDLPEVENGHVIFGNTMCLVSESGAKALAGKFNALPPAVRYLIAEVQPEKKGGRMQKTVLTLMNSPEPVEREPA